MRVKMNQQISGLRDGQRWPAPGEQLTVADDEGAQLCASGMATPVAEREQPETREDKTSSERRTRKAKD